MTNDERGTRSMRSSPVAKITIGHMAIDPMALRRGNAPARSYQRQAEALESLHRATPGSRLQSHERSAGLSPWSSLSFECAAPEPAFDLAKTWLALALAEGLIFSCRESQDCQRWTLSMQTKVFA